MSESFYDNPLQFSTTFNVGIPGPPGAGGDPEAIASLTGRLDTVEGDIVALTESAGTDGDAAVATHVAATDPHPQYVLRDEVGGGAVLSVAGRTGAVTLTKSDVGLGNVDDTSDLAKPISTATQVALDGKVGTGALDTLNSAVGDKADRAELAAVAFSGDYGQLLAKPVIPSTPEQIGAEPVGAASSAVAAHAASSDPHPQYTTNTEATNLAASALAGHTAAANPHPQYATAVEAGAAAPVQSVQGRAGAVVLTKTDVGLGSVDDVSAASLRDRATHTGTQPTTSIDGLLAFIHNAVTNFLEPGLNVTLTYDEAADNLVVAAAGGDGGTAGTDPEIVRDIIADALVGAGLITVVPDDALNTITVQTTATSNDTNENLRDRTTHTGMQEIATITGLLDALAARPTRTSLAPVALSGSYADLSNTPAIPSTPQQVGADPAGTAETALAAHTAEIDPHPNYTTVAEAAAAAPVRSVQGRTGIVSLTKGDVGLGSVDDVPAASLRARSTHTGTQVLATISDVTATGRTVATAADPAAARAAIGAGVSNLAVGTTAGTAAAGNDPRLSDQRIPVDGSVTAAKVADNAVVNRTLIDGAVTDAKVSAANKDGSAGTPSMRTLGTGANQALPGTHATDSDPHPQYLTQPEADGRYTLQGAPTTTTVATFTNQAAVPDAVASAERLFAVDVGGVTSLRLVDAAGLVADVQRDFSLVVRNQTGATIPKGTAVYESGVSTATYGTPAERVPLVSLARADAIATGVPLGVTAAAIPHNAQGRVLTHGMLTGVNTTGRTVGQRLWLSASTAGALTSTRPTPPAVESRVGVVVHVDSTVGQIYVDTKTALEKGFAYGLASLAADGKVPLAQLPQILTMQDAANASPVQSVSGRAGNVVLDKGDVGLPNVDNTSDLSKPVSTATATALSGKAATTDPRFTDQRVPTDGSVTNAKVATGAGISLDKTVNGADRLAMTTAERAKLGGLDAALASKEPAGAVRSVAVNGSTYTPTDGLINLGTIAGDGSGGTDGPSAELVAGNNITLTEGTGTLTIAAEGLYFTPETRDNDGIQAALDSASVYGGAVYLPGGPDYVINGTINVPTATRMFGDGPNSTRLVCASGALGITMLGISGGGDRVLENFRLTADGQKTSGEGIRATGAFRTHLRHLQIQNQYNAVEFEACTATWFSDTDIRDTTHNAINWHATFDAGTNGNNAFEMYLSRVLCDNPNVTNIGTGLTWGGGESFHVEHSNFQRFNVGFLVAPKQDQEARFGFIESMLCDFSRDNNIKIAPEGNGKVVGVEWHNSWSGTATNYGVLIEPPGAGGLAQGFKWVGGKVFHNGLAGVRIAGGRDVAFHAADIVGNSQTVPNARHGVEVAGGVSEWAVMGCRIGGDFMQGLTQGWAISVDAGASDFYRIIGNDVRGNNNTPRINDGGTGANKVVIDNLTEFGTDTDYLTSADVEPSIAVTSGEQPAAPANDGRFHLWFNTGGVTA